MRQAAASRGPAGLTRLALNRLAARGKAGARKTGTGRGAADARGAGKQRAAGRQEDTSRPTRARSADKNADGRFWAASDRAGSGQTAPAQGLAALDPQARPGPDGRAPAPVVAGGPPGGPADPVHVHAQTAPPAAPAAGPPARVTAAALKAPVLVSKQAGRVRRAAVTVPQARPGPAGQAPAPVVAARPAGAGGGPGARPRPDGAPRRPSSRPTGQGHRSGAQGGRDSTSGETRPRWAGAGTGGSGRPAGRAPARTRSGPGPDGQGDRSGAQGSRPTAQGARTGVQAGRAGSPGGRDSTSGETRPRWAGAGTGGSGRPAGRQAPHAERAHGPTARVTAAALKAAAPPLKAPVLASKQAGRVRRAAVTVPQARPGPAGQAPAPVVAGGPPGRRRTRCTSTPRQCPPPPRSPPAGPGDRASSGGEGRVRPERAGGSAERTWPQKSAGMAKGRPNAGAPRGGRGRPVPPRSGSRPAAGIGRPTRGRHRIGRPMRPAPRGPEIPDDVTAQQLDPRVRTELKTLPRELAERVARHLVAADRVHDPELAYQHTVAARKLAARVGAVREACGVAAYLAGMWTEALSELRAARRLTGRSYLAIMADCERALGRYDRALAIVTGPDSAAADRAERVELRIVESGVRRDMGAADAAVVTLQLPELTDGRLRPWSARLYYAYADALLDAGRADRGSGVARARCGGGSRS